MNAPVEAAKPAQKMSFWSEEAAAKVAAIRDPGETAWEAARRVVNQHPDAGLLARIIFGDTHTVHGGI